MAHHWDVTLCYVALCVLAALSHAFEIPVQLQLVLTSVLIIYAGAKLSLREGEEEVSQCLC
jgi:hypothetical protein